MNNQPQQPKTEPKPAPSARDGDRPASSRASRHSGRGGGSGGHAGGPGGSRGGRGRRPSRREGEDHAPEFASKTIAVRRVTRVVAGGRRFNFSVALVLGDKKGRVGVGIGKAGDVALAIDKASRDAKKHMIRIGTTAAMSIPHEVDAKFSSSQVILFPAPGRGLVAGSSVRTVLDLAGVTDVAGKILSRSKNRLNNARAAVEALKTLHASRKKTIPSLSAVEAPASIVEPKAELKV